MSEIAAPHLDRWYTYDQLTEYLHALESAFGERCRLSSIGRSLEGRELWMLEVTDLTGGDPEQRPGYIVQANIHAKEVAGTNSSLTLIWDLLANTPEDIDTHALLREVTFYIIPRINPDGAEFALTGGEIRSRREDLREPNCIYQADVDGDGAIVDMRVERPDGGWKASPDDPRILIPREPGDREGTFYAVYTEGLVHDPDGCDPGYAARSHDFNRNWPANWHQEHEQPGAGDYPFSEPEMRAFAVPLREPGPLRLPLAFWPATYLVLPLEVPFFALALMRPESIAMRISPRVMQSSTSSSLSGLIQTLFSPQPSMSAAIRLWFLRSDIFTPSC